MGYRLLRMNLPVLYLAQDEFGFLSRPVMEYVATQLEIPPAWVWTTPLSRSTTGVL